MQATDVGSDKGRAARNPVFGRVGDDIRLVDRDAGHTERFRRGLPVPAENQRGREVHDIRREVGEQTRDVRGADDVTRTWG